MGLGCLRSASPLIRHAAHATFSRKREKDAPYKIYPKKQRDRMRAIGIDFGTTNSVVALADEAGGCAASAGRPGQGRPTPSALP